MRSRIDLRIGGVMSCAWPLFTHWTAQSCPP